MGLTEWATAYEDKHIRQVRVTDISSSVVISTIWEGIVLPFKYGTFESVKIVDGIIVDTLRSATEEEAIRTHENMEMNARLEAPHAG
jgi:hypothetical protein